VTERTVILHFKDAVTDVVNTMILKRYRLQGEPDDFVSIETLEGKFENEQAFEEAKEKQVEKPNYPFSDTYQYIALWLKDARKISFMLSELVSGAGANVRRVEE